MWNTTNVTSGTKNYFARSGLDAFGGTRSRGDALRFASRVPPAIILRAVGAVAREMKVFEEARIVVSAGCHISRISHSWRYGVTNMRSEQDLWQRGEYTISTDQSRLNIDLIHDFISNHSYWGTGRAREVVERSIENSLAFGVYHGDRQVGFARIVTDYATFAWVADVFVVPEHRGGGLS